MGERKRKREGRKRRIKEAKISKEKGLKRERREDKTTEEMEKR